MIRPFDLRDVPLVAQIEAQGTPLYNEYALTRGLLPLQSALANYLSLRKRGDYTYVLPNHPAGFAQMRPRKVVRRAIVTFVAPRLAACSEAADVWMRLLESLAVAAGEIGMQHLVAEVPEESSEVMALHRVGFAIFSRQDILQLRDRGAQALNTGVPLRPCVEADEWGIQQLYLNTAPRLAQQADMPPHAQHSGPTRGYVLEEGGETMAYLEIRKGASGAWFSVVVHPQAEQYARGVIIFGLSQLGPQWSAPVYCCVHRYQEWLQAPLQKLGFENQISTAVMVKRLVVPIAEERVRANVLVRSNVTTPVVHSQDSNWVKG